MTLVLKIYLHEALFERKSSFHDVVNFLSFSDRFNGQTRIVKRMKQTTSDSF